MTAGRGRRSVVVLARVHGPVEPRGSLPQPEPSDSLLSGPGDGGARWAPASTRAQDRLPAAPQAARPPPVSQHAAQRPRRRKEQAWRKY
jgi:hypothetical protein